MIRTTETLT